MIDQNTMIDQQLRWKHDACFSTPDEWLGSENLMPAYKCMNMIPFFSYRERSSNEPVYSRI